MEHLKDRQYYIDRYDMATIKECLEMIDVCRAAYTKSLNSEETKKFSKGDQAKASGWFANQLLFQIKAKRYSLKEETIQKWIEEDRVKQDKYDNTPEPKQKCPDCNKLMHVRIKHLEIFDDPLRMMFLFECSSCKKKHWIYENGTERESTPDLCPKCKAEVEISVVKESKDKVIWKTNCSSCGFSETTVNDFKKSRAESKKKEEEEKQSLEKYRERFCSEEKGKEAFTYTEALKVANVVHKEELKKYDSFAYQKVSQMKKLSIMDLEKLLNEPLEKEHYVKLSFDKPEIGKHVIISFNLQDNDTSRREDSSTSHLQELIKETLEGTNWRLMADGVSYRLGYLSGRLKGYEREEDFSELSGEKKEEEPSKIDYETRMKYEGENVVQFARAIGEFEGIQNTRKRRLTKDPEGFFLDSPEDFYTCGICGENIAGNRTWWNLDGVRCADCQRNIKEGIIPAEIHKNSDLYIKDWQLISDSYFNINGSTVKKLRREGLLHGGDLKREDGTVYCTVYLLDENKEFLKKYPRKPERKWVMTDLLGDEVEI